MIDTSLIKCYWKDIHRFLICLLKSLNFRDLPSFLIFFRFELLFLLILYPLLAACIKYLFVRVLSRDFDIRGATGCPKSVFFSKATFAKHIREKKATKKKLHEEDLFSLSAPIDY